ncbi:MAG: pseudaminic acid synthase [Candidatus Omnitrophota bacterium]
MRVKDIFKKHNQRVFVIAEISANHGQNFNQAVAMIRKAKACGADAVKFQTYTPDTLTVNIDNRHFRLKHKEWGNQTLYQLYSKAYTPWDWFKRLKKAADKQGIVFFSTAFDNTAVDLLEDLGVPFHKISSFELVDLPLIKYMAKTKKPLIFSTGMASLSELTEAVTTARRAGAKDIILLKCVSNYPAKPEDMNLRSIPDMIKRFNCPVGISDHTLGIGVSIAAVAFGARVIEKHFTLSRVDKTPDSFFSLEPKELKELVTNANLAQQSLGKVCYVLSDNERQSLKFRRSLFAVKDIKKGEMFTKNNIRSIRPACGLAPKYLHKILGKKAKKNIKIGTPMKHDFV